MKKTTLFAFLMAILAPMMSAWAFNSDYYATLKAQVASDSKGLGKVYAGTTQTAGTYDPDESTSAPQSQNASSAPTWTFYAFAQPNEDCEFTGWSTSDTAAGSDTASPKAVSLTGKASSPNTTTYYAHFKSLLLDTPYSITFIPSDAGTYTVDGVAPSNLTDQKKIKDIVLKSSDASFFNWVINGSQTVFANPYTLRCETDTTIAAVFLTADQVREVSDYDALVSALADETLKKVTIPSGAEIVIESGKSVTVPSDKQLAVDGTLWIEGTLAAQGSVVANGTVSKCTKVITQTGDNGEPFNPYGDVKYWKTTQANGTGSISGVSGAASHVTVINGYGEVYRKAFSNTGAKIITCNVDSGVAKNHVTGIINTGYTDISKAYSSSKSQMAVLLSDVTYSSSTKVNTNWGILDCAGKTFAISSNTGGGYEHVILNGGARWTVSSSSGGYYGWCTCINCSDVYVKNAVATESRYLNIYDCTPAKFINAFDTSSSHIPADKNNPAFHVNYYSGGPYNPDTFITYSKSFMIYGGYFTKKPSDDNIAVSGHKFKQESDGYWHLVEKGDDVASVDGTPYESLKEAFDEVVAKGAGVIKLEKDLTIDERLVVPSRKNVRIELSGCKITATSRDGFILNKGELEIGDAEGRITDAVGIVCENGILLENDGSARIACGSYFGDFLLNANSSLTVHHGNFTGTFVTGENAVATDVADIRGGSFSKSVSGFLSDGIRQTLYDGKYWTGPFPSSIVAETTISGVEKAWNLDFLSADDRAIYNASGAREDYGSDAKWYRKVELRSMLEPWLRNVLDCAVCYDLKITSGSTQIYVPQFRANDLDKTLDPNEVYSLLVPRWTQTPWPFSGFVAMDTQQAGFIDKNNQNVGVVGTLLVQLYSNWDRDSNGKPQVNKDTFKGNLATCRYMLGGKKAAIDRDGSRVAYDSLAEAVADVQDGETVLVGADTADDVTLPAKAGVFTVDPYGFKFTGEVAAPNGYKIESQVEKASSAYGVESAKAVTYTVVQSAVAKVGDTLYPTLAEAVAAAGGAKITLLADCDEAIVLAEGQMLTLDADGHEFTGTVTAAEGCFATGAADGGTTTWTARKTVATVGDTPYASLDDALAAAGENATLTLKDDVTISAQRTLAVKRLILDGQGHTIGYTKSASRARLMAAKSVTLPDMSASGAVLKFTADATLKDVTIDARDADADAALAYAVEVHGGATLTIENVTLKNGAWYGLHVVGSTVQGAGLAVENSGFLTDVGLEGASPALKLSGDVAASGQLLFAVDLSDEGEDGGKTASVELPAAFAHYALDFPELGDGYMGVSLPAEGWTSGDWNDIIETGKAYMSAADVSDDDIASVKVVLGLLDETTAIPGTFVFEDANFTVTGNGHALSGTIQMTDTAGTLTDIVLGTDEAALTLDLTGVTTLPVALGDGVTAANVSLVLTEAQVASGTTVFTWDADGDTPNLDGVAISVDGKELTIDEESGIAYIGPCEARLTGSKTLYTSFADALAQATDSGDTVKLLADIDGVDGTFALNKDIVIDGDGHTIAAAANAEPRNVVQAYSGARVMFDVLSGAVTFKNLTLDGGEGHSYTFLVRAKGGAATFEDATLLNGGEADASGAKGVGYGAAVLADGAAIEVKGAFNACTGGSEDGIFPFTAILYQSGTVHFADGAAADIGDDLLLVGMVGAADVSTEEGRAEVDAMLGGMNIPVGFYPYTLSVADNAATSFTGASPRGWNDIIAYGAEIMSVAGSLGLDMDPDTTPVAVGLLADTVLSDTFVFENENFTVNGNGHTLSGTIQMTDTAGTLTDIVLGTTDAALTLDLTGVTTLPVALGDGVTAANVSLVLTEAQVASGTTVFTWDAEAATAPSLDGVTISVEGKELTIDEESGIAYIGPCEARLTGSKTLYTSFADALAQAADSGDTVTLLTDVGASPTIHKSVTIAGAYTLTGVTKVTDGAEVTLSGGITLDAAGQFYALDVAGGASVAVDGAAFAGGFWCNVHLNGGSIAGTGAAMLGDDIVVADDGSFYTYRGATVTDAPFGMNLKNVKGQTVTLPFMDIVRENGDEAVSLADADGAPLEQGASLLYVANMPGNGSQENVTLPARFGCYTLTIEANIGFLGDGTTPTTGWTVGKWNDIIDTGIAVLDAIGQDSATVPVTLTLNGDTVVPGDDGFTFRYSNLTIDGSGHALSGTIVYTDADPGVLQNVVLGADTVLDISASGADAVRFGADVTVAAGEKAVLVVGELSGGETLAIGRADAPLDANGFVLKMRDADGNLSDAPLPFGYELYVEDGALRLRLTTIVYPTGEQSVGVPIPVAWIHETAGLFVRDEPTADEMATIVERLGTNGANGHPYWQSYVLGLTPNGEFATALRLEAESAGEGRLTVRGLNVSVPEDLDAATTVTFRLAKRGADGTWTTVGEAQPMDEATRGAPAFTLDLASVLDGDASNGAVLALFADITTTGK